MTERPQSFRVYVDIDGEPLFAGVAFFTRNPRQKKITTTFGYDATYLADPRSYPIDPAFRLVSGSQYVDRMPGAFSDSTPDRWGRRLIDKAETQAARDEDRSRRTLDDVDYLMGVSDANRLGALRFAEADADFVGRNVSVPKLIRLGELLRDADGAARDDMGAIKRLLDTGTAGLGGANPKALVRLDDDRLAIAKFPHPGDEYDVIGWEAAALDLAAMIGIETPPRELVEVDGRHVLLVERFDRAEDGQRVGYMSAMTALATGDGDALDYADLAEAMSELGVDRRDIRAFYDRIVLSVLLHNTDDHMRNHGLLRRADGDGWTVAPIFDVNPDPDNGKDRQSSIAGAADIGDELDGLLSVAGDFALDDDAARDRIAAVTDVVAGWRDVVSRLGVGMQPDIAEIVDGQVARLGEAVAERGAGGLGPGAQPRRPKGQSDGGRFAARPPSDVDIRR